MATIVAKCICYSQLINTCIICLIYSSIVLIISGHQLDSEPKLLGLNGESTDSAAHGMKLLWDDISRSWSATKLYKSTVGLGDNVSKFFVKPDKHRKYDNTYSPKRSSKCMFGTPNPHENCGPEMVGKIVTKEYNDLALKFK
ncbi:uncharacterized protein LOC128955918 [Oppia nitens]|uniref:uncharacterized protein LOC128955918 n=1 Tax=Oppia nitens TaxID=1686743 RepID=UPI0023DB517C|nr:uncharacterized protein LOC128955918 [Oppia nitens]